MTIKELLKLEPRLQGLINSAHHAREEPGFDPQTHWRGYRGRFAFRDAVVNIAGGFCDDPKLQSSEVYVCLYQHIRGSSEEFDELARCMAIINREKAILVKQAERTREFFSRSPSVVS